MKYVLLSIVLLGLNVSCGGGGFLPGRLETGEINNDLVAVGSKPGPASGGIVISVTNNLKNFVSAKDEPFHPNVALVICVLDKRPRSDDAKEEPDDLCFGSITPIKHHATVTYYLDVEKTRKLINKSKELRGKISVEFRDSYNISYGYWSCYKTSNINIDSSLESTKYLNVTLTKRNILSYSCVVE